MMLALINYQFLVLKPKNDRILDYQSLTSVSSSNESTPVGSQICPISIENIPVFYTLFVDPDADETETERVKDLVLDQLANLKPIHHPVYVHSIGKELLIPNTTLLERHEHADERVTLESIWRYCQFNSNSKVIYLHSKGSFHPSKENDSLRSLLTKAALSDECASLPSSCDICSARFSPWPHPHTPGNMWLARCDYVSKLINPIKFEERMFEIPKLKKRRNATKLFATVGIDRYACEHYIHSHWKVQPCDLYTNESYVHSYKGIPDHTDESDFQLKVAPRFPLEAYYPSSKRTHWFNYFTNLAHRMEEYQVLYNETPDSSFWGWRMEEWASQQGFFNRT